MQHVPEVLETFNRLQWIQVFLQIKMNKENEITQVNKNCDNSDNNHATKILLRKNKLNRKKYKLNINKR